MLQGGANIWLQAVKPLSICGITPAIDVVFVGTKDTGTTTANKVYALNGSGGNVTTTGGGGGCTSTTVAKGGILWTYTGTAMDIISSTPYVDYTNNTVWVTSRSNAGTQASVWKFNAANGALIMSWNNGALGESDLTASAGIDSSPVPNADGAFVYVGTNAGNLKAIKVSDNSVVSHTPASGAGPIKGMPWPVSYNTIGQTTSVAYVNSASTAPSSEVVTSCAATLPSVTVGNTNIVVVALRQSQGAAPVSTISDGASTYSREVYMENPANARTEIWSAKVVAGASTTVTVNLSAGSEVVCAVSQYSGVGALGLTNTNSGSGTSLTVNLTTQDNNNWVVAGFAQRGTSGTLSAQTGTLRQVKVSNGSSNWVKGALTDNTSATPASVTNAVTATQSVEWAAAALELRTKSTDTIIFSRNATVHSVDFNGTALSANWVTTPTGAPATVSTPVDDGAGNIYIGGSDGKVHRLLVSDGSDAAQVPATAISGTFGDPTFNYDLNKIHVGGTDGHIYTFATGF
jgi:hypothetical protein